MKKMKSPKGSLYKINWRDSTGEGVPFTIRAKNKQEAVNKSKKSFIGSGRSKIKIHSAIKNKKAGL